MGTYCPNPDSSPTLSQPTSRKSQQMACEICGLGPVGSILFFFSCFSMVAHDHPF